MDTNVRIRKVKIDRNNKIEIHWERFVNEKWDSYSMICNQEPRPDFGYAMTALVIDVLDILDWPELYKIGIRITSVSFSYSESGIMGAVISGQKPLRWSTAPFCFNTPHKPSEPYSEDGDDSLCLDQQTVNRLMDVQEEAWLYIQGKRAQESLFEDFTVEATA